jgi:hypothetical protein
MKTRTRTSSLVAAGLLAASGPTLAQEPYPDLKGSWTGTRVTVRQGKAEHSPSEGQTGPVFRESQWTFVIDRQEGNRFTGTRGRTEEERRDPTLGVIRADRRTIHMVDDDGTFLAILTGPDTMEVCRTEVDADSRAASCGEFVRQR